MPRRCWTLAHTGRSRTAWRRLAHGPPRSRSHRPTVDVMVSVLVSFVYVRGDPQASGIRHLPGSQTVATDPEQAVAELESVLATPAPVIPRGDERAHVTRCINRERFSVHRHHTS